jgi:1-acyl-sn-glycerol-3-phosphate acyltransferase
MPRRTEGYPFSSFFSRTEEFDPDNDALDLDHVDRFMPIVDALSRWFRPEYHGLENIPRQGGALLVGNHGVAGYDPFFLFLAIYRATGRLPRGLGDRHLFMEPLLRRLWQRIGALDGTPEVAARYLRAGHLVNVYPGGAREALKTEDQRYRLQWEQSTGFVRLAMETEVPVILHMGIGPDDSYRILGKLRPFGALLGHTKYELPIWLGWGPLPRPVKFVYYISEPVDLEGGAAAVDDSEVVARNHQRLWDLGHEMLDQGRALRKSVWLG